MQSLYIQVNSYNFNLDMSIDTVDILCVFSFCL